MERGAIIELIEDYCVKKINLVECNSGSSNQHEFNVTKEMKRMLGGEKKYYTNTQWLYLSDTGYEEATDTLSWYDARANSPNRSEWRLYYGGNNVVERAKVEDNLFVLKVSDDYLILIIVESNSKTFYDLKWLLGSEDVQEVSSEKNRDRLYELVTETITKTEIIDNADDDYQAIKEANSFDVIDKVMVRNTMLQISFNSLISGIENGDYIIPGFQRFYRWTEAQVENLAVSFMRGMPIPPIYCYRNKKHQLVILDGQQRVLSLYLYYRGEYFRRKRNASADLRSIDMRRNKIPEMLECYEMREKRYCMKIRGDDGTVKNVDITYKNLSEDEQRQLDYFTLTIISIDIDKEKYRDAMLHKIFANLNIGGTPLSNQELRNGIYYNDFYIMLFNFNRNNTKWRLIYGGSINSKENKKSKDVEVLLRMCSFWHYTRLENGKIVIDNYRDNMSVFLDEFSNITETFSNDKIEEFRNYLEEFLDCIDDASGNNKVSGLVAFFVAWNLQDRKKHISADDFKKITYNDKYKQTILSHASGRANIEERFRYVYEKISEINY